MSFDLARWGDEMRQEIADFAADPRGTLQRSGVNTVYGFLLGSTMLPVVAAYATDPNTTIAAIIGMVGGLGSNLIANLAQQKYDQSNVITVAAQEAQSTELAPAYEALAKQLNVMPLAEQALQQAGHMDVVQELRDEVQRLGKAGQFAGSTNTTYQTGGVNFGAGNTVSNSGDIFGGDKHVGPDDATKNPKKT